MAIVGNKSDSIGDVILVIPNLVFTGVKSIGAFVDSTTDETVDRFFVREFRWSKNNEDWEDWEDLTDSNLQQISVDEDELFFIQYRYTRAGTDNTGTIAFNSVMIEGDLHEIDCGSEYANSIFSQYFHCSSEEVLAWAENVTQKMYGYGHVPNYILRTRDEIKDKDYLDFWRSVAKFFAYYVTLARKFGDLFNNRELLREHLQQRNLFLCGDETLEELQGIAKYIYKTFFLRGGSSVNDTQGEVARLICRLDNEDIHFSLLINKDVGWVVSGSSPCYKGLKHSRELSKAWEPGPEVENLDLYSLTEPNSISIEEGSMKIDSVSDGFVSGIGNLSTDKAIPISPYVSYEISLLIKTNAKSAEAFDFGVILFDSLGNVTDCIDLVSGSAGNMFLETETIPIEDDFIQIRGLLYNVHDFLPYDSDFEYRERSIVSVGSDYFQALKPVPAGESPSEAFYWKHLSSEELDTLRKTNWRKGASLRMPEDAVSMNLIIQLNNESEVNDLVTFHIRDLRITPLSMYHNYSFINRRYFGQYFLKNNSGDRTNDEILNIINKYFMSYNISTQIAFLPNDSVGGKIT